MWCVIGPAVEAGKLLGESNVSARVINMASIKPIDADAIIKQLLKQALSLPQKNIIIGGLVPLSEVAVATASSYGIRWVSEIHLGESGTTKELMATIWL